MRNIKLTIEYDGSRYQGWSRLGKNESNNTISNKLQEVLRKMTGEFLIELYCGCRTEAGVHAYAQVVNFKTECTMDTEEIKHYLNRYLPMDIAITEVDEVPERFHAQLGVISQTYVYRMTITRRAQRLRPQAYLPLLQGAGQEGHAASGHASYRNP